MPDHAHEPDEEIALEASGGTKVEASCRGYLGGALYPSRASVEPEWCEQRSPSSPSSPSRSSGEGGMRSGLGTEVARAVESLRLEPVVGDTEDNMLTTQVRALAEEEFHEDALEIVDTGGLWKATALVDAKDSLIGFVVFGILHGAMSLRYIAIVPEHRGKGYGRRLVEYVCQRCAEQGVRDLTLFSKRELVAFYKAMGFREAPEEMNGVDSEDDLQVPLVLSMVAVAKSREQLEEDTSTWINDRPCLRGPGGFRIRKVGAHDG
eukprot:TRINITY_DN38057_c0_g1_i1.p1 TRINITY_DN38057_c0_g1~~TRINITY_DN38057_c0_g1_i1.p1  ORF type:complete len:264 (+),score=60.32 TRINITY_DN38057_c0_g1_i1:21-812(+)